MTQQLDVLLDYCKENKRVCPMPEQWSALYNLLPGKRRVAGGWSPPPPLILAAWYEATDAQKTSRLTHHLRWAWEHGVLCEVDSFLRGLPEDQWSYSEN
jgi:hypothetical protein